MNQLSDEELIGILRTGSDAAYSEIYNRYWKKMFTAAANKAGNVADAEDIVQQIFVSIWARRHKIEIRTSLQAYLAVSVKYRVYKLHANRAKYKHFSDEAAEEILEELSDDSTQQLIDFNEVKQRVDNLINSLPEKCQLIYDMSRNQGNSHKEIAKELNVSEKTVEFHITKALKVIKKGLHLYLLSLQLTN